MKRLSLCLFLLPCLVFAQAPGADALRVDFIDVGQADSILVRQGESSLLIDAGNNEDQAVIEAFLTAQGVTRLDTVVATHAHEDHIGSMDAVVRDLDVGAIWFPHQVTTTATYRNFLAAVRAKGLKFQIPGPGASFVLGTAKCTFLGPQEPLPEDLNEGSAVLRIDFGQTSFLFTGDADKEAEAAMLAGTVPLKASVLKVGHHGSSGSTSAAFLKAVAPAWAVLSVGEGNTYHHPSPSVVARLKKAGVQVYRTDKDGTITAFSDGQTVTFTSTVPRPSP